LSADANVFDFMDEPSSGAPDSGHASHAVFDAAAAVKLPRLFGPGSIADKTVSGHPVGIPVPSVFLSPARHCAGIGGGEAVRISILLMGAGVVQGLRDAPAGRFIPESL
jgi:hypothetical protein